MMPSLTDRRLAEADEDQAVDVAMAYLRAEAGCPVGAVVEPLRGGGYLARISWQTPVGVGGRRGRKRWQTHAREILPPGRSREDRIKEPIE
jgi:hypothetical protein